MSFRRDFNQIFAKAGSPGSRVSSVGGDHPLADAHAHEEQRLGRRARDPRDPRDPGRWETANGNLSVVLSVSILKYLSLANMG